MTEKKPIPEQMTNKSVLSSHSTAVNTPAEREIAGEAGEQTSELCRETIGLLEDVANLRKGTDDLRKEIADLCQEAAGLSHEASELRKKVQRAKKKNKRIKSAHSKSVDSIHSQAQLREANERLVVATVQAQTMTEAAEKATEQMTYMAEHDFLTGLPNRSLLTERLEHSIALAQRHHKKVALLYLDLDNFKHINDSLGHAVGDQLLQSVSRRLKACVRLSDTVSRQGGDEFVVLLSEVEDVQTAVLIAEKLIKAAAQPHVIDTHRLHVTLSIGISLYPDDGENIEVVFRNADTAMYHAKKIGRNNYQVFTIDMNVRAVARLSVEQALHRALEQSDFVLHYQPKVNLKTGVITGAEALLRWQRSANRLVCPTKFVAIAEDSGLILPIGKWVLREACRQSKVWLDSGLDLGQISVNVSSKEFHNKDFLGGVHTILSDTGLDPCHLEFELTESGLMQDTEQTMLILHTLKNLGVQIAVDDFGTGYSSLSYLRQFPINTLKIDQSFVQNINGDSGEAIVSAIIAMGTSLKQRVVAEGIETKQQLAFLRSQNCAEGQGYYFARPLAPGKFAALLVN